MLSTLSGISITGSSQEMGLSVFADLPLQRSCHIWSALRCLHCQWSQTCVSSRWSGWLSYCRITHNLSFDLELLCAWPAQHDGLDYFQWSERYVASFRRRHFQNRLARKLLRHASLPEGAAASCGKRLRKCWQVKSVFGVSVAVTENGSLGWADIDQNAWQQIARRVFKRSFAFLGGRGVCGHFGSCDVQGSRSSTLQLTPWRG